MNKRFEKLAASVASSTILALGVAACTTHETQASVHPTQSTSPLTSTLDKSNIFPSASATEVSPPVPVSIVDIAMQIARLGESKLKGIHCIPENKKPAFTTGFEYDQPINNLILTATEQTTRAGDPSSVVAATITKKQNGIPFYQVRFSKTSNGWDADVYTQAVSGEMVETEKVIGGESVLNRDFTLPERDETRYDPIQVAEAFGELVTQVDQQLVAINGLKILL